MNVIRMIISSKKGKKKEKKRKKGKKRKKKAEMVMKWMICGRIFDRI